MSLSYCLNNNTYVKTLNFVITQVTKERYTAPRFNYIHPEVFGNKIKINKLYCIM